MKVTVIGGNGLIGTKVVRLLTERGHAVVAASRATGIDLLTGAGLPEALAGADVVVDVSNSPSFDDEPVMAFFKASTGHLQTAAKAAGVKHYVAVSVVGADRMPDSGYIRAKVVQEALITAGSIPYTIVRFTQFFEFVESIVGAGTKGNDVRLSSAMMQPIAAADVALAVADAALAAPVNGVVEIAGPEPIRMDELGRQFLRSRANDPRTVVTDDAAGYFGMKVDDHSLVPLAVSKVGPTRFDQWLIQNRK